MARAAVHAQFFQSLAGVLAHGINQISHLVRYAFQCGPRDVSGGSVHA